MSNISKLEEIATRVRRHMLEVLVKTGNGHIGGSLSSVEIFVALFISKVLRYNINAPDWPHRDRFILSKGHASLGLFATLAEAGLIETSELYTYGLFGSRLGGHSKVNEIPGLEMGTTALGHGFAFSAGVAFAGKLDEKDYRVYCLIGDGECQEGSIWETAMFAAQHSLGNLVAIIDHNKLQSMDKLSNIINLTPLKEKWESFGFHVIEVDGHDINSLISVLDVPRTLNQKPLCVLAHTVKGKGISYMENEPLWHVRLPSQEEYYLAKKQLSIIEEAN